jgi:hypothetical protein
MKTFKPAPDDPRYDPNWLQNRMEQRFGIVQCPRQCSMNGNPVMLKVGTPVCPNCGAKVEQDQKGVAVNTEPPSIGERALQAHGMNPTNRKN